MNIIEAVKKAVENFPRIGELSVHIEFAEAPESYGLASIGETILEEDILGNETRQHSFLLYANFSSINDYERLANSSVLIELSDWLNKQKGAEITTGEYSGKLKKLTASNGMLAEIPEENALDTVQYQLHINAEYTVIKED